MEDQYNQRGNATEPPPQQPIPQPTDSANLPLETNQDAKTWGMLAHLSALCGFVGIPSFVGPLVVWLMKKNEHPFVDEQGKEALNFQITIVIALLICIPLCFICIGFILLAIVGIGALVLAIIAAVKASRGEHYHYPWCLRLIK